MSMQDERPNEFDDLLAEEAEASPGEEDLSLDGLPIVEDAFSDEAADPAMAPVIEAGGGVSEGFEQSEALLIDHATSGVGGTNRILRDAGEPEREPDPAVYGEADEEHSSEREHD
jgi:hypothetical protein